MKQTYKTTAGKTHFRNWILDSNNIVKDISIETTSLGVKTCSGFAWPISIILRVQLIWAAVIEQWKWVKDRKIKAEYEGRTGPVCVAGAQQWRTDNWNIILTHTIMVCELNTEYPQYTTETIDIWPQNNLSAHLQKEKCWYMPFFPPYRGERGRKRIKRKRERDRGGVKESYNAMRMLAVWATSQTHRGRWGGGGGGGWGWLGWWCRDRRHKQINTQTSSKSFLLC